MAVTSFFRSVISKAQKTPPAPPALPKALFNHLQIDLAESGAQAFYDYLLPASSELSREETLSLPQKLVLGVVRDKMQQKELRSQVVPRLPMIIPKLLRSLRDPNSSARDYVKIINKDPAMSAAVVKLANSAYFNPSDTHIGNIERAVVKLGISGLRSVLSAAVMQPIIQQDSPYHSQTGKRLWHHSLMCAVACEQIAESRGLEPFKVYLLGLVHDIGKIALYGSLCKEFQLNGDQQPSQAAFLPLMRSQSAYISYCIAQDWQLPEELILALQEQIEPQPYQPISTAGWVLHQANTLCEHYAVTPARDQTALQELVAQLELHESLLSSLGRVALQK